VGFARASRALRDADRRCGEAERAFSSGAREQGFAALQSAVFGYFADRMNVPPAAVTSAGIDEYLRSRNVDDDVSGEIGRVVAACSAARYAAGAADSVDGPALTATARAALRAAEKVLR
jgi:hypothetical protein